MRTKEEITAILQEGISSNIITKDDIERIIAPQPTIQTNTDFQATQLTKDKTSSVDVMYFIAGIILFFAVMSSVFQSWGSENILIHFILTLGIGSSLWATALYLIHSNNQSVIRNGLINSILLTGSLLNIAGGYLVINDLEIFSENILLPLAVMSLFLGIMHIVFDRIIRRDLILSIGIFLSALALPLLLFYALKDGLIDESSQALILVSSSVVLASSTRAVAKVMPNRSAIRRSLDSLAAFVAFSSMYVASYGEDHLFWYFAILVGIVGIFYSSIKMHDKHLLGLGSFFTVVIILSIAFRYFSGYGVTFSLIFATIGLLAFATTASMLNKKYFK